MYVSPGDPRFGVPNGDFLGVVVGVRICAGIQKWFVNPLEYVDDHVAEESHRGGWPHKNITVARAPPRAISLVLKKTFAISNDPLNAFCFPYFHMEFFQNDFQSRFISSSSKRNVALKFI